MIGMSKTQQITKIEVPFGKATYYQICESVMARGLKGSDATKAAGYMLVEKISQAMKEQGYGRTAIGRAIFEDALDWMAQLKFIAVVEYKVKHKAVPKKLIFEVSVPKRE